MAFGGDATLDEQVPKFWYPITRGIPPTSCEPGIVIIARRNHDEDSPWFWNRHIYKRKANKYEFENYTFINNFAQLHSDHHELYYNSLFTLDERLERARAERDAKFLVKVFGGVAAPKETKALIGKLETEHLEQVTNPKTTYRLEESVAAWTIGQIRDKRSHVKGTIKAKVDGLLSRVGLGAAVSDRKKSTVTAANIVMHKISAANAQMQLATYDADKVRSLFSKKGATQKGAVRLQYVLAVAYAQECTVTYEHDAQVEVEATADSIDVAETEAKIHLQHERGSSDTFVYTATVQNAMIPIAILPAYVKLDSKGQFEHWRKGLIKTNSAGAGGDGANQLGLNKEPDRPLQFDIVQLDVGGESQEVAMLLEPKDLGQACLDLLELMDLSFPFVGMQANDVTKPFENHNHASELVIDAEWQSIADEGYDPVIKVDTCFVWKLSEHVQECPWDKTLLQSLQKQTQE